MELLYSSYNYFSERILLHRTVHFLHEQPDKRAPINDIQTHLSDSGLQVLSNTQFRQILRISSLVNFNTNNVCLPPLDIRFVNHYLKLAENVHVGKKSKNTPLPLDVELSNERFLLHKER